MKKMKSGIAWLLSLVMVLSLIPGIAFASSNAMSATLDEGATYTKNGTTESDVVYGLTFNFSSDKPIKQMNVAFSYDTNQIVPVRVNASKGVYLDVAITDGSTLTTPFAITGIYDDFDALPYDTSVAKWKIMTGRMAVLYTLATTATPTVSGAQDMFTFYFKLADGVTLDDLNGRSICLETNPESAAVALLYPDPSERKYAISIKDTDGGLSFASESQLATSITYPGSDKATPLTTPTVALAKVDPPGVGGLKATITDSNDADMVEKYVVEIYSGDTLVKTIDTKDKEVAIPEEIGVIDAGTSYTATVKAVASTAAVNDGYANSAVSAKSAPIAAGKATPVVTTVEVTPATGNAVIPADAAMENATVKFTATVKDQYGVAMGDAEVEWAINPKVDGISISNTSGVVTVTNEAKEAIATSKPFTVTATSGTKYGEATLTIARATSVYTVEISESAVTSLTIPADGADPVSATYTATVTDQYGASDKAVTWSVNGVTGVEMSGNTLTVSNAAKNAIAASQTFTVTAAIAGTDAKDTVDVTVSRAGSVATSVVASGETTVVIPLEGAEDNTYTYSAKVYDQYGAETTGTITWESKDVPTGITVDGNKVVVTSSAAKTPFTMIAKCGTLEPSVITVTPVDLAVNWKPAEDKVKATSYTYGDPDNKAGTLGNGTATVGVLKLDGVFGYETPDERHDADTTTITITFKVTSEGAYQNKVLTKAVTLDAPIAQKTLTVSWSNTSLTYNGTPQAPSASVTTGVGDEVVELTVTGAETNAGKDYTAVAAMKVENTNYTLDNTTTSKGFEIAPKSLEVVWTNTSLTYTGKAQKPAASVTTGVEGDTVDLTVSGEQTNAGENYTATAAMSTPNSNYTLTNASAKFTIAPATISIKTDAPAKTILANDADKSAAALKASMALPATVTVSAEGMDDTAAAITWADSAVAYNEKGAVYTYVGTVNANGNYANQPTLTATLTVKPVSVTGITTVPTTLTLAKSTVADAADLAALGIPAKVTLAFNEGVASAEVDAKWNKTLADLQTAAAAVTAESNQEVTVALLADVIPAWATCTTLPSIAVTITNSFPVNVAFTTAVGNATYGEALTTPVAEATDAGNGLGGATTIKFYYKSAADTSAALGSEAAPTDAGSYICTAVYDNGTHYGKATCTFTIAPKTVTLKWNGTEGLVYNGEPKTVTATVTAKDLIGDDTCDVTVINNVATNAGNYTAKATGLSNANYKLPAETTKDFAIARADRNLSVTNDPLTLTVGKLTETVAYTCDDADKSAAAAFSSSNTDAALVSTAGKITAVGNGSVVITVTVAETTNYNADSATLNVTCIAQPLVSVTASDGLTAEISGDKVIVTGTLPAGTEPTFTPVAAAGADAAIVDGVITVTVGGTPVATYTVDTSKVVTLPGTVTVTEGALVGATGSTSGLAKAIPQSVVDEAAKLGENVVITVYAVAAVAEDGKSVELNYFYKIGDQDAVKLSDLTQDITVTLNAAKGFNQAKNGTTYASIDADGTFTTSLSGTFQLLTVSTKTVYVAFTYYDGSTQTKAYSAADIGTALPTDSGKSGFKGWKVNGGSTAYKTLTEELFAALNNDGPNPAEPVFSSGSSSGGGGSVSAAYTITATAGKGGSISPSGDVKVTKGDSKTFTVKANTGYEIADVLVDGKSVGAVSTYTFKNVTEAHTIKATFAEADAVNVSTVFTDISDSTWCHDAVQFVFDNGLMNGTTTTTFEPGKTLTRGMWVTMLYRMAGSPAVSGSSTFSDVDESTWCLDAILWGTANGIINGFNDGTFRTNDVVTRQQLVAILYRYAQYMGYDTTASASLEGFTDADTVWAKEAMEWALAEGILNGTTAATLTPNGSANRGQAATFLMRFVTKFVK